MNEILQRIPHRAPFLFVDEILDQGDNFILTSKLIKEDEDFFKGHFPQRPIMPGVLLCEAAFQSGALLMSHMGPATGEGATPVVSRIKNAKFKNMVLPGDVITIYTQLEERIANAAYFKSTIKVKEKKVMEISYTCNLVP